MSSREVITLDRKQTISRVRAARAEHAGAAAFYANRVEQPRAASGFSAVARWSEEYRRSGARCRLLGEMLRLDRGAA